MPLLLSIEAKPIALREVQHGHPRTANAPDGFKTWLRQDRNSLSELNVENGGFGVSISRFPYDPKQLHDCGGRKMFEPDTCAMCNSRQLLANGPMKRSQQ